MAYTPINGFVFTTAYSSALAGMNTSGRQTPNLSAAALALVAGAFAQALDTLWDDAVTPSQLVVQSFAENVTSFFEDRQPPVAMTSASDWTGDAAEIIDVVVAAEAYYAEQGIVSPPWGGGGGSGITELTGDIAAGPGAGVVAATMQGIQDVPVAATPPVQSAVPVFDTSSSEYDIRQLTQDDILPGFSITGFSGGSTVETGAVVTNPAFTASYSSLPTSAHITNTDGIDSPLVLTTPFTAGTVVGAFSHSSPANVVFTLTAIGATAKTATQTIAFEDRGFGGIGAAGATSATASGNNAVLNGGAGTLSDSFLAANFVGTSFGPFSPVSQVIYIQLPAGAHTFKDENGFGFPMTAVNTFSFVNQQGATVSMTLWGSNTLSSPFTVTVAT
jgi:hypothetical protein